MARTPALQLPYVKEPDTSQTGRRLFRVQVLPKAKVEHPSAGDLDFTGDRLSALVERFKAGAYDIVPFVLADSENRHTDDPERFRGEVKGLELADNGLYATVETTDAGAQVLADNPRLPVSVRIVTPTTGRFKGQEVLAHVCGTLDPVVKGMRPWEAIEASGEVDLTDLSAGCFSTPTVSTDASQNPGTDAPEISEEEKGALKSFFGKIFSGKDEAPSDEDFDRALAELVAEAETSEEETTTETEREPVAASLSDDDRQKIDMANATAERMAVKAATTDLSNRLDQLVRDGVPPAMVDATRERLIGESDEQKRTLIDFANDRKPAAVEIALATLEAAKGTVDFSEHGSSLTEETDEAKAIREQAEAAVNSYTGQGS